MPRKNPDIINKPRPILMNPFPPITAPKRNSPSGEKDK
jgi:hypothetical protein